MLRPARARARLDAKLEQQLTDSLRRQLFANELGVRFPDTRKHLDSFEVSGWACLHRILQAQILGTAEGAAVEVTF